MLSQTLGYEVRCTQATEGAYSCTPECSPNYPENCPTSIGNELSCKRNTCNASRRCEMIDLCQQESTQISRNLTCDFSGRCVECNSINEASACWDLNDPQNCMKSACNLTTGRCYAYNRCQQLATLDVERHQWERRVCVGEENRFSCVQCIRDDDCRGGTSTPGCDLIKCNRTTNQCYSINYCAQLSDPRSPAYIGYEVTCVLREDGFGTCRPECNTNEDCKRFEVGYPYLPNVSDCRYKMCNQTTRKCRTAVVDCGDDPCFRTPWNQLTCAPCLTDSDCSWQNNPSSCIKGKCFHRYYEGPPPIGWIECREENLCQTMSEQNNRTYECIGNYQCRPASTTTTTLICPQDYECQPRSYCIDDFDNTVDSSGSIPSPGYCYDRTLGNSCPNGYCCLTQQVACTGCGNGVLSTGFEECEPGVIACSTGYACDQTCHCIRQVQF